MVGAGVWGEGGWGVIVKGYRVSVWEDETILEMGDDDGCPAIWMYLIQLNPTPRDGKIYVMYSTVIKKKEKGGDQKPYGHILIKKKEM